MISSVIDRIGTRRCALLVLAIALVARITVFVVWHDHLSEDRDAYVGIAKQIVAGNGIADPVREVPTAFRPPLYPIMLAAIFRMGGNQIAVGAAHVMLGVLTVWLVLSTGRRRSEVTGVIAALIVAVDPLLLLYTTFVMTEVTMAFLLSLLIWLLLNEPNQRSLSRSLAIGLTFGACALCRPSIWPFGILLIAVWLFKKEKRYGQAAAVAVGMLICVVPWTIRNAKQVGVASFTTTHAGYTLHLANNESFFRNVVQKPWGTTWSGQDLDDWNQHSFQEIEAAGLRRGDEPAIDQWHRNRALDFIRAQPVAFIKGCGLRFCRFWSPTPNATNSSASTPKPIVYAVGSFYCSLVIGLLLCAFRVFSNHWAIPLWLLLISFSIVHSVFWSNARMRAPLIPAISILAASGFRPGKTPQLPPASHSSQTGR